MIIITIIIKRGHTQCQVPMQHVDMPPGANAVHASAHCTPLCARCHACVQEARKERVQYTGENYVGPRPPRMQAVRAIWRQQQQQSYRACQAATTPRPSILLLLQ